MSVSGVRVVSKLVEKEREKERYIDRKSKSTEKDKPDKVESDDDEEEDYMFIKNNNLKEISSGFGFGKKKSGYNNSTKKDKPDEVELDDEDEDLINELNGYIDDDNSDDLDGDLTNEMNNYIDGTGNDNIDDGVVDLELTPLEKKTVGRPESLIRSAKVVTHNNKKYVVYIMTDGTTKMKTGAIIDYKNFHLIDGKRWYKKSNYLGDDEIIEGKKMTHYMHNVIKGIKIGSGKGATETVDHINRIGMDNREANLEIKSQTNQNHNRMKRSRHVKLPENCGIKSEDIPQYICFYPAKSGNSYFEVDIKHVLNNGTQPFRRKTTKAKDKTLIEKLEEAKKILLTQMDEHPQWFAGKCMNGVLSDEGQQLYREYVAIMNLAGFDIKLDEKLFENDLLNN
ncbi:MAG: HNH endonuclease [Faunusvirus sp.]|jgi:hypothetical protein|uniref:HNH endonuclease n=1 Tax=Faunusvirus sp. TaxID=2487766 RepID=A0A3G4ZXH1_9VIRU|nr:MAG: HNH endonuclease [Faunusvirus sp.]